MGEGLKSRRTVVPRVYQRGAENENNTAWFGLGKITGRLQKSEMGTLNRSAEVRR